MEVKWRYGTFEDLIFRPTQTIHVWEQCIAGELVERPPVPYIFSRRASGCCRYMLVQRNETRIEAHLKAICPSTPD